MLDFSSGSEEDECEFQKNAVDTKRGGNAATEPMSFLQHGFSKLLERVYGKPELIEEDSCPSIEESSEEEAEDQQGKTASYVPCNPENHAVCSKQRKTPNISRSSESEDREEGGNDKISVAQRDESFRRHHVKRWTKARRTEDEEGEKKSSSSKNRHRELSRTAQSPYHGDAYSDESEDLDMEIMTRHKENTSGSNQGDRRRTRIDSNKRRCVNVKDKSKHTEDIEMFTSSEEEHTPKKIKHAGCRVSSAETESTTVKKANQRSKSSSPKCRISPSSSRKAGAIDSVLGQVLYYYHQAFL